jgi:hypothetical protein
MYVHTHTHTHTHTRTYIYEKQGYKLAGCYTWDQARRIFQDTPAWKDLRHWGRAPPDPYDDPFREDVWGRGGAAAGGGASEGSDYGERREVGERGDWGGERLGGDRLEGGGGGEREKGQLGGGADEDEWIQELQRAVCVCVVFV